MTAERWTPGLGSYCSMAPREYHPNVPADTVEALMFVSAKTLAADIAARKAAGTWKRATPEKRGMVAALDWYMKNNVRDSNYDETGFAKRTKQALIAAYGCSEETAHKAIARDRKRRGLD